MKQPLFIFDDKSLETFISVGSYSQVIILADVKTNGFCVNVLKKLLPSLRNTDLIVIPDGDQNKNISTCQLIWDQLIDLKAGRHSLLLNVGGGMVCDTGGFAASVYKRGIPFVNVPTTLLAMADAAHGGKTGINSDGLKNVIGVFQQAEAVYIQPLFLQTLDDRNLRSGIAEILKHALLQGTEVFQKILHLPCEAFYTAAVIQEAMAFKNTIVQQDPLDQGVRQTLNLGHSIGHAIESYALKNDRPLLHGEAVMLGLIYELMISHELFQLPLLLIEEICQFKNRIFPQLNFSFSFEDIEPVILNDKKNDADIRMSLLRHPGDCTWQVPVSGSQVKSAIDKVHEMQIFNEVNRKI
jgi:3-dehydroquinate synthase